LILGKVSKVDATRCQILRLKCTKFDFRWSSAPDHAGGAYSTSADPIAVFKGPTSKRGRGNLRGGRGGKGKERGGQGRFGPQFGSLDPPVFRGGPGLGWEGEK